MTSKIQVQDWDRHKNMARLKPVNRTQMLVLHICFACILVVLFICFVIKFYSWQKCNVYRYRHIIRVFASVYNYYKIHDSRGSRIIFLFHKTFVLFSFFITIIVYIFFFTCFPEFSRCPNWQIIYMLLQWTKTEMLHIS